MLKMRGTLIGAMLVQAVLASLFSITRHMTFKTSIYDIGDFEQILFNLIHGAGLTTTIAPPYVEQSWLAVHFSPILYLLAPIYALLPTAHTLLVLHCALIACAAWPLFWVAKHILGSEKKALVVALLYLINPFVLNAAIWDFHEIAFSPVLFACGLLAVVQRRRWLLIACCIALLAVKEHYGLAVAGFAVLWYTQTREWKFSLILGAVGLVFMAFIIGLVTPMLSPQSVHFMLQGDNTSSDRYSWLSKLFSKPYIPRSLLYSAVVYICLLIGPLLFLPLRAFAWVLPAAADGAANMLSMNPMMRHFFSYHSAAIIPIVLVAACVVYNRLPVRRQRPCMYVIAALSLLLAWKLTSLPLPGAFNPWDFSAIQLEYAPEDKVAISEINALIGADSVAAQVNVGGHFAKRRVLYDAETMVSDTRFIVLRPASPFKKYPGVFGIGASQFGRIYKEATTRGYREVYNKHGWVVLSNE